MIFNNNSHYSVGSSITMAEGYDCSYGTAQALIEGARNDFEMFKAMLTVDQNEIIMRRSNYVNESDIVALSEGTVSNIFKKIAELLSKLVAKIKAIIHTFMGKMSSLFMKDKELVKKYEKEILSKSNIGNLEVKWRKIKKSPLEHMITEPVKTTSIEDLAKAWNEDKVEMVKNLFNGDEPDDLTYENALDDYFEDEDTVKISEIPGGIRSIMNYLTNYQSDFNKAQKNVNEITKNLEKIVSDANKKSNMAVKSAVAVKGEGPEASAADANVQNANHAYEAALCLQDYTLKNINITMDCIKVEYKQNRAAFAKAITASNDKLKESTYMDAVFEAAEDEVDAVIDDVVKDEDLSDLSAAETDVKDGDVTNDANKLVYDKVDNYTDNAPMDTADGSIDITVNSREESAFFGKMFY